MIISINAEKAFDKIQHTSVIKKKFNKLRIKENFLNLIKVTYKKTYSEHHT